MTREAHPDEISTASYLEGRLQGEARERFEAHLADCAVCRSGLAALALESDEETSPVDDGALDRFRQAALAGPIRRSPARRGASWLLAAAALTIIAVVTYRFGVPETTLPSGVERSAPGDAGPLGELSPASGSIVDAEALSFRWSPVIGADRYVVEVSDSTGRKLATLDAESTESSVTWPADRAAPRGTLLWTVRAMTLDRVLEESRPIAFECR